MADNDGKMTIEQLIIEIRKLSKEDKQAIAEDLKNKSGISVKEMQDLNKVSMEHLQTLRETASMLNDMQGYREANLALAEQELIKMADQGEKSEAQVKAMKDFIEQVKNGEEVTTSINKLKEKGLDFDQEKLENQAKIIKNDNDALEGQKKYGAAQKQVLKGMADALGMGREYKETFLGAIVELNKGLNSADLKEREKAMAALADNFQRFFNLQNAALGIFSKVYGSTVDLFKNFDKAQASLAAATGQGREFNDVLYDVGRNTALYGVSMADAGKAIGTLVNQTSYFGSLSKTQQVNIAGTVSMMEKLGVSASDSAAIFQNLNQGLGMTGDQAINMQRDLAMAGVGIGVSAGEITKNFNASLKTLMVYGKESVNVFKGLQAAAKAAGVEVSTLLTIAGKFDTFAGAAEGVGKMNALLGTQLSTTQMLMMTEDERIRTLVESVQAQGIAFGDMDKYTQRAIANAAGITDMAEANRIFGMSLDEYDENERKLKASTDAQKQFEDAVSKTVPVLDKFKLLGAQIIVTLEPFFEILSKLADRMTEWLKTFTPEELEGIGTFLTIASGLYLLIPIFKSFIGVLGLFSQVAPKAESSIAKLGKGIGGFISGVGKGLASAIRSIGTALSVTLSSLAAAAPALPVIFAIGAAAAAIGWGLGQMFEGLGKMADFVMNYFKGIAEVFRSIGEVITGVVSTIVNGIVSIFGKSDEMAEFEARSAEAMASIVTGDHAGALASIKAMVEEINKMGQDIKVSSTIENLALVTAGKATDMTGKRIESTTVNVVSNVKNSFDGMKMILEIGGEKIEGVIKDLAAEAVTDGV